MRHTIQLQPPPEDFSDDMTPTYTNKDFLLWHNTNSIGIYCAQCKARMDNGGVQEHGWATQSWTETHRLDIGKRNSWESSGDQDYGDTTDSGSNGYECTSCQTDINYDNMEQVAEKAVEVLQKLMKMVRYPV